MKTLTLGKSGLLVTKTSFGALPIQRVEREEAVKLLHAAFDGGIRYYDTANAYTDSEEKLGAAFCGLRREIVISTKSLAADAATATAHIENSLQRLQTDYIDLFQLHNVSAVPDATDKNGAYFAAMEAKRKGYIGHIGVTTHRIDVAFQLVESGLFETLQFPFSYLSGAEEQRLVALCREKNIGFIAMKGLAGGLLTNVRACHAFMKQYDGVVPIWGIQRQSELDAWLAVSEEDPSLDAALSAEIDRDRKALSGSFCRGCGYCEPCTVGIQIHDAARMDMLLRRSPWQQYYTPEMRENMEKIRDCVDCGLCASRCPYGLNTPKLLRYMLEDYEKFYEEHKSGL